jgi:hypothetical protein
MTVGIQDRNSIRKGVISLKFTRIFMLGVVSLILNLSVSSLSFSSPKAQFSILYTNDVMGEVEPCG